MKIKLRIFEWLPLQYTACYTSSTMFNKPPKHTPSQEDLEERKDFNEGRDRELMEQAYQVLKQTIESKSNQELPVAAVHFLSRLSGQNPEFRQDIADLLINDLLESRGIGTMPRVVKYAQQIGLDKEFIRESINGKFFSDEKTKAFRSSLLDDYWK